MAKKKTTKKAAKKTTKKAAASGPPKVAGDFTLHIVSDATGTLANHLINAVLTQFPQVTFDHVYHTFQDSTEKLEKTIKTFRRKRHIVLHALVDPQAKAMLAAACWKKGIPQYDLTGNLVQFIADYTGQSPANELSRLHQVNAGYFRRIESMEYTANHDDGQGLGDLSKADIVLVGLSRVSKSPTATFLGSQGFKTANVSVTPQTGFPDELAGVKNKIVALTVQPKRLQEIRAKRVEHQLGVADSGAYADLQAVIREVMWANEQYQKRDYPILDTTYQTIEQVAATIRKLLNLTLPDMR